MATLADIIKSEFEAYAKENGQKRDVNYLSSPLVQKYVSKIASKDNVYSIRDMEILQQIHEAVLTDIENKNSHQNYSAAILHYRKFLSLKVAFK